MENILTYIAQCAICLTVLYPPFRWMLRHAGREDIVHIGMPGYESRSISLKDYPMQNGRITLNVKLLTIK